MEFNGCRSLAVKITIIKEPVNQTIIDAEMPLLKRPSFNVEEEYQGFRYTEDYLRQKYNACFAGLETRAQRKARCKELCLETGYTDFSKFEYHLEDFLDLSRTVPSTFMQAIGVDDRELDFSVETDYEHYCEALKQDYDFKATVHVVYQYGAKHLDNELTMPVKEKDAVEFGLNFIKKINVRCSVTVANLKKINIYPDGRIETIYYYPKYKKTKNTFYFYYDNENQETPRIG